MSEATCKVQCSCIKNKQPKFKKGDLISNRFGSLAEVLEDSQEATTEVAFMYHALDRVGQVLYTSQYYLASEEDIVKYLSDTIKAHKIEELTTQSKEQLQEALKGY